MSDELPHIVKREWDSYDLSEDATLDKYALDYEAERQAAVMDKWMDLLYQAQSILAKKKREFQFIEAELTMDARRGGMTGIAPGKNITDTMTKAWVCTQPKYRKALEEKDKAENDVTYLQNARTVLDNKKAMIKIEADLWICGYFARPSVSKDVRVSADAEKKEQVKQKLTDTLAKRKRREAEE
jgi:DNA-binding phage protein